MKKIITTIAVMCLMVLMLTGCTKMHEETVGTLDDNKNFAIVPFAIDTTVSQEEKDAKKEFYKNNFLSMDLKGYGNTLTTIADDTMVRIILDENVIIYDIRPITRTSKYLMYVEMYQFKISQNQTQKYNTIRIVDNEYDETADSITLEYEPSSTNFEVELIKGRMETEEILLALKMLKGITIKDVEVTTEGYDIITIQNSTETIIVTLDAETGYVYTISTEGDTPDSSSYITYTQTDTSLIKEPKDTTTNKWDIYYYTFKFLKDYKK